MSILFSRVRKCVRPRMRSYLQGQPIVLFRPFIAMPRMSPYDERQQGLHSFTTLHCFHILSLAFLVHTTLHGSLGSIFHFHHFSLRRLTRSMTTSFRLPFRNLRWCRTCFGRTLDCSLPWRTPPLDGMDRLHRRSFLDEHVVHIDPMVRLPVWISQVHWKVQKHRHVGGDTSKSSRCGRQPAVL